MDKQPLSIPKLISFFVLSLFCIGLVVWFSPLFSGKREYFEAKTQGHTSDVLIGNLKIKAEVVKNPQDLAEGLSHRNSLSSGYGMLFDLGSPAKPVSFWMKEMRFNLDMIWINDGKVVGIDRNIPYPKSSEPPMMKDSPGNVQYVLEIIPGQTQGVEVGAPVTFR